MFFFVNNIYAKTKDAVDPAFKFTCHCLTRGPSSLLMSIYSKPWVLPYNGIFCGKLFYGKLDTTQDILASFYCKFGLKEFSGTRICSRRFYLQVFYYLGELDDALTYALGAENMFYVDGKDVEDKDYINTLLCKSYL